MVTSLSRRNMLKGAAGIAAGTVAVSTSDAWSPGPNENLTRDLTPGNTPIRLGMGLNRPEDGDIDGLVRRARETGHTSAFIYPPRWNGLEKQDISELKTALNKYGVEPFEVGGYVNMLHPDTKTRSRFLKLLVERVELAEEFECRMVGTISGSRDDHPYGINVHPDNWTLETWKLLVDGVRQVLRDTAGCSAALGMEAQVTTNLNGPKAHKRLMEDVGNERCVVNLDPTNMVSLEQYYHTTELIEECFDLLGESIYGCHAKDTYIWPDKQTVHIQEVCPGRGVMDYETYLVRMSKLKWPRTIEPEHLPSDQYPEADAYIKRVAKKVGVTIVE